MLQLEPKREYADMMERALYNLLLGSMSLDGMHYFYVNPLEVWPEASEKNPGKHHVKAVRQKWFGCSCCPPNVARLIASLEQYIYSVNKNKLFAHLFIGNESALLLENELIRIKQQSALPWAGDVNFEIQLERPKQFTLALRIPSWCTGEAVLRINGEVYESQIYTSNGYAEIDRVWNNNDQIEWILPMSAQFVEGHPQIRANAGKAAIQRGPIVYCLEEKDNGNLLASLSFSSQSKLTEKFDPDLFEGVIVVEAQGWKDDSSSWDGEPYRLMDKKSSPTVIRAIPYYLWGNRGKGEMAVWTRIH